MDRDLVAESSGVTESAEGTWGSAASRAILSGFVASAVMLFAFVVAYGAAWALANVLATGQPLLGTLRQWFAGLTNNVLIDLARPNLYVAVVVYFAGGLLWALLYAYVVHPRLSGPGWRRGVLFSLVPWLISLVQLGGSPCAVEQRGRILRCAQDDTVGVLRNLRRPVLVVLFPLLGGGLLGLALGAGPLPVLGNLLLHLVYGVTLGEVYGPLWDTVLGGETGAPEAADVWANLHSQTGAAKGLVGGLALGAIVGLVIGGVAQMAGGEMPLGLNPLYVLPAATLLGAALGVLIGSFLGLATPRPQP